jgi:carboxypeptidase C (cathepsin A)
VACYLCKKILEADTLLLGETTPGVNSYAGYIDLAEDKHSFFWFFESRSNPSTDPITLWLNGTRRKIGERDVH